jgi:hypothetical protein
MRQGTTQAIQPPDHQCIAFTESLHGSIQLRSGIQATGYLLNEDPFAPSLLESVSLHIQILVIR